MQKINFLVLFALLFTYGCNTQQAQNYKYAQLYEDLPFEMPYIHAPVFPDNQVNVADFGGNPNGIALNTEAFEKAMEALSQKGGGTLVVPKGVWFTGPIVFRSNINMHLEKGALILFSPDFDLYPLVETIFEGLDTRRCQSPISGRNLENIAITGQGSINGYGEAWRPLKKEKVPDRKWKQVVASGGFVHNENYWFPTEGSLKGHLMSDMNVPRQDMTEEQWIEIKDFLRPVMVSFIECKNVYLHGVLFENSPAWNIHPLMCENVIIDGVYVKNPSYSQNGDGLDLESCVNSIVVNSIFDVGDDAICIKSGKDEDGRRRARPTENLIVDNCKVFHGHGGFIVGSEMSGGVKNISVKNCQFLGTDVGLRFKSNRGRGGVVENIYISDIYMYNILTESFLFDLFYGGKSASESLDDGDTTPAGGQPFPVTEETPVFKDIYVKNLVSRNARRAMFFNGLSEMNIENINLENAFITARYGAEFSESKDITFKDVTVIPDEGPAYLFNNVKNFKSTNLTFEVNESGKAARITGSQNSGIQLPGLPQDQVEIAPEVDRSEIIYQ
ncbi:glycoside hydrolase family 28 protein [Proteiniphilum sp. X52]|uniref:glycoside hydrolase family 28 protein n=1 Tax=Proteiniphilum sp. X52 TaxID=2382159 RepID=UPI000F09CBB5|nr:glycoside hydrolase family 28 protein [Proteiniphilum sp. X52]RNC66387.1 glycoside hydrolase family 28 protein [Proteiniphilum sp. X52]